MQKKEKKEKRKWNIYNKYTNLVGGHYNKRLNYFIHHIYKDQNNKNINIIN